LDATEEGGGVGSEPDVGRVLPPPVLVEALRSAELLILACFTKNCPRR
jgi:hypothetical protein